MTPKNKAIELVKKFRIYSYTSDYDYEAKGAKNEYHNAEKCAIIAVDEILDEYWFHDIERKEYWQQVKTEIKKL
jgi:hypothetical protein